MLNHIILGTAHKHVWKYFHVMIAFWFSAWTETRVQTDVFIIFLPLDRYLWMKTEGSIAPLHPLSAMYFPFRYHGLFTPNLLRNVSRSFINPAHLTWCGYFTHVVRTRIHTSHTCEFDVHSLRLPWTKTVCPCVIITKKSYTRFHITR